MTQPDPPDPALELAYELQATLRDFVRRLEQNSASSELLEDACRIIRRTYAAAFEVPEGGPGRRLLLLGICAFARERLRKAPSRESEQVSFVVRTYDELVYEDGAKLRRKPPDTVADELPDARAERLQVAACAEAERLALVSAVLKATPKTLGKAEMALIKAMTLGFTADPESVKRHARRVKKKSRES